MRSRTVLTLAASLALATSALAQHSHSHSTASTSAKDPVFIPSADLKWVDLDPKGAPGVKIVDLWGDHTKGAYGAYLKLPAGFVVPLHTHTYDMHVTFISGTYLQTPEGKPEVRLGPGSYMMQPGGNYRHITGCDKSSDCVLLVESKGPFDLHVVGDNAKPVEKK